jgi:periplasmic divalent cation tolerance protein
VTSKYIQIISTVETKEQAGVIANLLVEKKLAACVQISGPIESVYSWQGKLERSKEWRLTIKTKEALYDSCKTLIKECHTYDVPEIIAHSIIRGSEDYLSWVDGAVLDSI